MINTLFLQSEVPDPYELYEKMLSESPVLWDSINKLWAIYSYNSCKEILSDPTVQIPILNENNALGLNDYALAITGKLARLSNGLQHAIAKQTAFLLFENMKAVSMADIMSQLMKENNSAEIDWVNKICKRVPISLVLKSFAFTGEDGECIQGKIERIIRIMLPDKTRLQVSEINAISNEIWRVTEKYILSSNFYKSMIHTLMKNYKAEADELLSFCVSNLIGLFIQCYDAGRGILSNCLLQILKQTGLQAIATGNSDHLKKSIIETLRFDPPVHNTKRIAGDDLVIDNHKIKKGQLIIVALAAANRDPEKFNKPGIYNIERKNNHEHLTFGIGLHKCLAENFSINMTMGALAYLFEKNKPIKLTEKVIEYEPMMNVRLPKNIYISLK